jgi:putative membrane protein
MKWTSLAAIALSAALAAACNGNKAHDDGAVGTAGGPVAAPVADKGDRTFIEHMLDANQAEMDLGKLAADHAMSAEVKSYAKMMVTDHSKAGASLDRIATRQGIPELAQREEKHRELKDRLSALHGAEFDREYMAAMVEGHEDVYNMLRSRVDVGNFGDNKGVVTPEKEHGDVVEGDVNQWAAGSIGVVKHHLEEAKQIQDHLKNRNTTN